MAVFVEITCPYCHDKSMYAVLMRDLRLKKDGIGLKKECAWCERVFSFDIRQYMAYEAIDVMEVHE